MLDRQDVKTARGSELSNGGAAPFVSTRFNGLSGDCQRTLQAGASCQRALQTKNCTWPRTLFFLLSSLCQGHSETVLGLDLSLGEVQLCNSSTTLRPSESRGEWKATARRGFGIRGQAVLSTVATESEINGCLLAICS